MNECGFFWLVTNEKILEVCCDYDLSVETIILLKEENTAEHVSEGEPSRLEGGKSICRS